MEQPVSGTDSPKLSSGDFLGRCLHQGDTQIGVVGGGQGGEVGGVLVEPPLAHGQTDIDDDGGYAEKRREPRRQQEQRDPRLILVQAPEQSGQQAPPPPGCSNLAVAVSERGRLLK